MGMRNDDLLDPMHYVVIPHVAVLDECVIQVPASEENDGGPQYFEVTPEFLARVVFNGNRREQETGDLCPLIIGRHTRKNDPEAAQPKIVGYARKWVLDTLGNTDRQAAHVDFWIKKELAEEAAKYPRRSVEIWRNRAEIDPIALLGATTPDRDLGLLPIALSRRSALQETPLTFYCDRTIDMPTEKPDDQKNGAAKKEGDAGTPSMSDVMQMLSKLVASISDLSAQVEQALTGGTGGGAETAPGGTPGEPGGEPMGQMSDEEIENFIKQLEAGGGPGAEGAPGGPEAPRKEEEPVQNMGYPGGQPPAKLNRADNDVVAQLRVEVEALKLERDRTEITSKVQALQSKGILIENPEEEVRDILALPPDLRPILLSRIENKYRRAPVNGVLPAVQNSATNQSGRDITTEQRNEVVKLARAENVQFEVAFKKLYGRYPWETMKV